MNDRLGPGNFNVYWGGLDVGTANVEAEVGPAISLITAYMSDVYSALGGIVTAPDWPWRNRLAIRAIIALGGPPPFRVPPPSPGRLRAVVRGRSPEQTAGGLEVMPWACAAFPH